MIDYQKLLAREFPVLEHKYDAKDCVLYALGLGLGADPCDQSHLRVLYEGNENFAALPAMVNVLTYPGFWAKEPDTGLTWEMVLHGEQSFTLHDALPTEGTLLGKTKITGIIDKGADKGALVYSEREITEKQSGRLIATVAGTMFARGDGGFASGDGDIGKTDGPAKPVHKLPDREPDLFHDFKTSPRNALIYRLSGDFNPLHADPEIAKKAGFKQPILHGLCTLAVASWSVTAALCNGDCSALKHMQLRFSSPVYPGETIRTEMWQDGNEISFRARALERDVIVLNNGLGRIK